MMPLPQGHLPAQHSGAAQAELAQQSPEGLTNPNANGNEPPRLGLRTKAAILAGGVLSSAAIFIPGGSAAAEQTPRADSAPVPAAQESANRAKTGKAVNPRWIMKQTLRIYFGSSYDDPTKLYNLRRTKATPRSIIAKGKCDPKDPYDPYGKSLVVKNGKVTDRYCSGSSQTQQVSESPEVYARRFSRMSDKAASSAGVPARLRGNAKKATANNRRAVIGFANDDPQAQGRQLKTLVLRFGKKPLKRYYPRQTGEAQQ